MTSLGDVVHLLPALSEAATHLPGLTADWVVEEGFAAIPAWHPAVDRVIPSAIRRWRRQLVRAATWREIATFRRTIRAREYDLVLDAQGLVKSALVALQARGPRAGQDFASAREPLASLAFQRRFAAPRTLHAITRSRLLMAQALGYAMGEEVDLHYGLTSPAPSPLVASADSVLCLHGTARPEKEYPEGHWIELLRRLAASGLPPLLPWGNERERARAERLVAAVPGAKLLPRLSLAEMGGVIAASRSVIGVDTGLMHLAAAFRKPGVGLYPATPPERFGARAEGDAPAIVNLSQPADLLPETVFSRLSSLLFSERQE
jgi:heptosyltransferase-1